MPHATDSPPTINVLEDELLTDAQAAKVLARLDPRNPKKKMHPTSVWRLRTKGKRGIKLPSTIYGRGHVTTRECIRWFYAALQHIDTDPTPTKHRRAVAADVEAECVELGI